MGAVLALVDAVARSLWPAYVAGMVDVAFLAWATGALHLDGLADTADGLYGDRSREKALSIMKDSRVGAMGLVAVVLCLGLKWAAVSALPAGRVWAFLSVCALSRGAMVFGFRFLSYARPEGGTGNDFFAEKPGPGAFLGFVPAAVAALFLGPSGMMVLAAFFSLTFFLLFWYQKKLGGITGDLLGAMCEIMETALFLAAAIRI